jgi:hypothetical protein
MQQSRPQWPRRSAARANHRGAAVCQATELDPSDSTTWLELGDSYSTLRGHGAEARRAYAEGARVQRESLERPGSVEHHAIARAAHHIDAGELLHLRDGTERSAISQYILF